MIRAPLSVVFIVVGFRHCRDFALPVAGLDEAKAQSIYFALKRASTSPDQERVAVEWLAALQLVQVASARILAEMDTIEANLQFWTRRLDEGRHFWFTLFRRGPVEFAKKVAQLVRRGRRQEGNQIPENDLVSDAELVEKRVLLFRLLKAELSEAAAKIQAAAALLYLRQQQQISAENNGTGPSTSQGRIVVSNIEIEQDLFIKAHTAVDSCMLAVSQAFRTLESGVHGTLDSQQAPGGAATGDRRMLSQALGRVLGVIPLRRIWSRSDVTAAEEITTEVNDALSSPGTTTTATAATNEIVLAVQNAVGFIPIANPDTTVHIALVEARRAALLLQRGPHRLVPLPAWLEMPSQIQQNWVRYSVLGLAVGYGTVFIIRHSRLTGSHDLDDWAKAAVHAVRSAWAEHVVGPLERVRGELFNTFRRRPAIVSMGEYEADRDSLQRMLEDFKTDFIQRRGTAAAMVSRDTSSASNHTGPATGSGEITSVATEIEDVQLLEGMELMMRSYEQELKRPVRNLVSGDLMRSLLIQVQKLKVDTESAMLEIDQILRANELSISLVAAVPAFLIAGVVLYSLGNAVTPAPPDPKREAVPARMAMIEVERALETLANCEEMNSGREGKVSEAAGMFIFRLAVAYKEAEELFQRHRGMFGRESSSEWNNLRADLLELAAPAPAGQKMRTAARMMRAYAVYQQF
ncbi:hypothetical protein Ndes2526B_g05616 [Nannochloris sp. 'desiccata']|nr:putative Protein DGS1, mitochondrial [Chlorella desiccata (nom. nud.)]